MVSTVTTRDASNSSEPLERNMKQLHALVMNMCSQEKSYASIFCSTDSTCDYTSLPRYTKHCRPLIIVWYIKIINRCNLESREILPIAMNYIDRFSSSHSDVASHEGSLKIFALASLRLAIKTHASTCFHKLKALQLIPKMMGFEQVALDKAECLLLQVLSWRLHPPTAPIILIHLLKILGLTTLPESMPWFQKVSNLASSFTEVALLNHTLATKDASLVAYASIMNALDILSNTSTTRRSCEKYKDYIAYMFPHFTAEHAKISLICSRLRETTKLQATALHKLLNKQKHKIHFHNSISA